MPETEWPGALAAEDHASPFEWDLVEVVRRARAPVATIQTIRIAAEDHRKLAERYAKGILGGVTDDVEIIAFGELAELVDKETLELEVVA